MSTYLLRKKSQWMELTAVTEVNIVVVDVCGEEQEAWQRQTVL